MAHSNLQISPNHVAVIDDYDMGASRVANGDNESVLFDQNGQPFVRYEAHLDSWMFLGANERVDSSTWEHVSPTDEIDDAIKAMRL